MSRHTLSVLVEDQPGVLARISALFSRRGFNIDSLAVGPTELPGISRMTIVVNVEESPLEQVTKQLNKLVEVLKIVELDQSGAIDRELMLVKVRAVGRDGGGEPVGSRDCHLVHDGGPGLWIRRVVLRRVRIDDSDLGQRLHLCLRHARRAPSGSHPAGPRGAPRDRRRPRGWRPR